MATLHSNVRAALLRSRAYSGREVQLLLEQLGVAGHEPIESLTGETRERLQQLLRTPGRRSSAPPEAGADPTAHALEPAFLAYRKRLGRVRDLLERYRLLHRPLVSSAEAGGLGQLATELHQFLEQREQPLAPPAGLQAVNERLARPPEELAADPSAGMGEASADAEYTLRHTRLVQRIGLTEPDRDVFWLLLAAELLPEFQWLTDGLQRQPSGGALPAAFVRGVLSGLLPTSAIEQALAPDGPLQRYRLIERASGGRLYVTPRVIEYLLLGPDRIPPELSHLLRRLPDHEEPLPGALLTQAFPAQVIQPFEQALSQERRRFLLVSPKGAGAQALAMVLGRRFARVPLEVRADLLVGQEPERLPEILREARLAHGLLLFREVALLGNPERITPAALERFIQALAEDEGPLLLDLGAAPPLPLLFELLERLEAVQLNIQLPEADQRRTLWDWAATQEQVPVDPTTLDRLRAYPLGIDHIRQAARLGRLTGRDQVGPAADRGPGSPLIAACQHLVSHRLGDMALRVQTRLGWNDLVVPEDTRKAVEELIAFARLSTLVLDQQGYGKKLSYGKGLSALFSGPSGTGKTMVAGLIAAELGVELFRVDLSRMVSKYIGETEQRLSELFSEAWAARAALLFDEADSLFGSRTEVRSSTDRYANLEVNYLLQKMEEHQGIVFLTSNLPRSIDQAFLRRLRFKIHFPAPDAAARKRLWQRMIPEDAPRRKALHLDQLATEFELSGGAIRNAVLRAAFQAASDQKPLSYEHLAEAAAAEYQEMGRLVRRER